MKKLRNLFGSKKNLDPRDVDQQVEAKIKQFPKKMQKQLRFLHNEYKAGRLIVPAGNVSKEEAERLVEAKKAEIDKLEEEN